MELRSGRNLGRSPPPQQHGARCQRRRGPDVQADRISALPDEMLLLVLAHLGCVDAVQSSLLSHRWRGLWTDLRDLAFRRLEPTTIDKMLSRFAHSSVVSLRDVRLRVVYGSATQVNSLLCSAARLSPAKLLFTLLEPHTYPDEIKLPSFPSTVSIDLDTKNFPVKLPPAGEFTSLERLSLSGRIAGLAELLNRCPHLRVVSMNVTYWDEQPLCVTPLPGREFTALESLSLTGRIDGLGSLLNCCRNLRVLRVTCMDSQQLTLPSDGEFPVLEKLSLTGRMDGLGSLLNCCRNLRVLSVTYMDSRQLILPSDGEFPVLEKLSLSGNIADIGTSLNRCPRLHMLNVTFRGVAVDCIEVALATLEEVVLLGLTVFHLGIDDIDIRSKNDDPRARFTSLLLTAARLSPQEFVFRHCFHKCYPIHMPSFHRTTSIEMILNTAIRFRKVPARDCNFSALEKLSLSGGCNSIDLATLLSRCQRLRELSATITSGEIKVHSASLQKLYVSSSRRKICQSIDIMTPVLKQLKLVVWDSGDISVSISAPMVEKVLLERAYMFSDPMTSGFWHLRELSLETAEHERSPRVLRLRISAIKHLGAELAFIKEMEALLITDFSVLELHLQNISEHLFGAVVLRLFRINRVRAATKKLKVVTPYTQPRRTCPATCPCDNTMKGANQKISSTCIEEIEMENFHGNHCERDFLTRILRCSPMLTRVSLKFSSSGYCNKEVEDIFLAYPSVKLYKWIG